MVLRIVTALPYNFPIGNLDSVLLLADGTSFLLLVDGSSLLVLSD